MSTIDWDAINGAKERLDVGDFSQYYRADAPTFSNEEIDAALAKIDALPALGDDPDLVATFWPVKSWALSDLDFRDVTTGDVTLADLSASNADLSRKKLVWHVQNPGESKAESVFDQYPIVLQSKNYQTIVDGAHRLAALMLLGVTAWACYLVPK